MPGRHQSFDRVIRARAGVHVTVAAFQTGVGMRPVGEAVTALLMAVGAQGSYGFRFGSLAVWVVAGLALDASVAVDTGLPFVGCGFMTGGAQFSVWCDRHGCVGMSGLEWPVTGFAGDSLFNVPAARRIPAGGVTLQAGDIRSDFAPIPLKDWR